MLNQRLKRSSGFTLLEMMAVIMIIGLALGGVSLMVNSGSPENQMSEAIERFMTTAEYASEKAVLSGEAVGLRLEPPEWQTEDFERQEELGWRYYWVQGSYSGWTPLRNVKPVPLPNTVELTIVINEIEWKWEEVLDRLTPLAVYYPSGDLSDISIKITDERAPDMEQNIILDEYGDLVWKELMEIRKEQEENK